jgi:tripartite-type tricarboxylate transporter receptor subunit TctC
LARFNALPAAVTVRADAPWKTIEEFLAHARRTPGEVKVGNSGNGSIWQLAAAALQDKVGVQFSHIPFQGGNPAVLALMGGHIDAVTVSPIEVMGFVASGRPKTLAVMSDKRVKEFEDVPTLKERNIDVVMGSWAGPGVAKNTPAQVVEVLKRVAQRAMNEPVLLETLDRLNLNAAYADDATFKAQMVRDTEAFRVLVDKLKLKNWDSRHLEPQKTQPCDRHNDELAWLGGGLLSAKVRELLTLTFCFAKVPTIG